jgi:dedicated sortase system histidine kinase
VTAPETTRTPGWAAARGEVARAARGGPAKPRRVALGIRAQLLLVLTVFLAIPWLGYEYVRELERFLRDAQERALAGTAQAVATALHDRERLFDVRPLPADATVEARAPGEATATPRAVPHPGAVAEVGQILQGLSRTTARIWVVDRDGNVLARAGSLKRAVPPTPARPDASGVRGWLDRVTLHPLYALVLAQPTEDFSDEADARAPADTRALDGALAGILTTGHRATADGRATVVAAAHPIWVGDRVRGAVLVEETTNAVLAERNLAFERLFDIVLGTLLVGSVALTAYATWLAARIRRLRDDAERAIDPQGRVIGTMAGSAARDEIGDLSRSFGSALARLSQYAAYQENMASRLSHELRTPIAVVRSSLDNLMLMLHALPDDGRVYIERAQGGLNRLAEILTRMTEATRLEQSLHAVERERFDLGRVVAGCIEGYRAAWPRCSFEFALPPAALHVDGAPDLVAQMLDKLVANAVEFAAPGTPVLVRLERADGSARLSVSNDGAPLPDGMRGRLFDSMVSVRRESGGDVPHLGLGLYIVRLIAEFHGGRVRADDRADGKGVVVTVELPLAGGA